MFITDNYKILVRSGANFLQQPALVICEPNQTDLAVNPKISKRRYNYNEQV